MPNPNMTSSKSGGSTKTSSYRKVRRDPNLFEDEFYMSSHPSQTSQPFKNSSSQTSGKESSSSSKKSRVVGALAEGAKKVGSALRGGMTKDEADAAADRDQARKDYLDEQDALLKAAKDKRAQDQAETYAANKAREKAIRDAGKETISKSWARTLSPDEQRKEQREMRKSAAKDSVVEALAPDKKPEDTRMSGINRAEAQAPEFLLWLMYISFQLLKTGAVMG